MAAGLATTVVTEKKQRNQLRPRGNRDNIYAREYIYQMRPDGRTDGWTESGQILKE
jgi:hypothetical protein